MNNQIFYGQQQTNEWHKLRLGLFTSSVIYHLFEESSKQAKATALMLQLRNGTCRLTNEALRYRPTAQEVTYICKYLVDAKFIKKTDEKFLKKELKGILKDGVPVSGDEIVRKCLLILTACHALNNIEVVSGSMEMICKKKALELIYEAPDEEVSARSLDWGNDNEGLAKECFEMESLEFLDCGDKKISFIQNLDFQTGSSPDNTISGLIPVEYKNPFNRGIHYDHWQIKSDLDLFKFDRQKYYQVQHQIWILGAEFGYFVSFDKRLLSTKRADKALFYIKIPRNETVANLFEPKLLQAIRVRDEFINNF